MDAITNKPIDNNIPDSVPSVPGQSGFEQTTAAETTQERHANPPLASPQHGLESSGKRLATVSERH